MLGERWRTPVASVVLAVLAAIALLLLRAPGAHASDAAADNELAAATNSARASAGVAGLAWAGDLASVAARQAERMAARGAIYHNPNLGTEVSDWDQVGENVGVGQDADQVHEAFMNSPHHRDNILSPVYTQVGFGTAVGDDGRLYVAEVFRLPQTQADVAPADAAAPDPAPAPAPVAPAPTPAVDPQPVVAPPAPAPPVAIPVAVATAFAPRAVPHTLTTTDVRPRLVASFRSLAPVHQGVSIAVWIAALLGQGVLIAHMCTFWRRYRIGSGS